eukprot:CAMPEP_0197077884 /NCGR_PEP_ID=MMETSP1384-20130603/212843_1 /TAXON_ID=29189 /ORGANISM="Ammonia sp." /LENGTH=407 /DNA_ID=CAMNT_0042516749 /DNA_START=1 /DNA_END=1221 /DNA_ORIENTATION=+
MDSIAVINNASMIIDNEGKIFAIDSTAFIDNLVHKHGYTFSNIYDCKHKESIIPGLVDSHTHPVWSGDRCNEWDMKLRGKTYMDIHKAGGGIGYTVKCVRKSSFQELLTLFLTRLRFMSLNGTTLLEAKSGYGLSAESEIKMLKVIERASELFPGIEIIGNYCGGHSIPSEHKQHKEKYIEDIIHNQLPQIARLKLKTLKQIDVFHEKGIFEYEDTKRILSEGIHKYGLKANFHGDELHCNQSAELGYELNRSANANVVQSISHLEEISDRGIELLAKTEIAAVLLPTTCHILKLQPPPYKKMMQSNCIIALGTDFNPNAHCLSMPYIMNLACNLFRFTMNQSLIASTINSAHALGQSDLYGSLEEGKYADFVVVNHANWQHLIYEMSNHPIKCVFKKGEKVVDNAE